MKRIKKLSPMQELMNKMTIDETYTKPIKYKFPTVKANIFPKSGYNYQADILELVCTKDGYNRLLCVVDMYSNYCDFEPMKTKTSTEVLKAFKRIFKRGIVPMPKASIRTDNGSEFKSVVDKYFYDNNILHLWSLPDRHKQMGNVENLNKQVGRVLYTYLQNKSMELQKDYVEWTDIIDELRHNLNDAKKHPIDVDLNKYVPPDINMDQPPKYKKNDLVYRRLEVAIDKYGNKLHNGKFRQGENRYEMIPRKVVQVLAYSSPNPWRYILDTLPNVSYAEAELLPAHNETEEKFIVRKIIGKKTEKKIIYYLVWFKKSLKKDATWEPRSKLVEDGLDEYIKEYEDDIKLKRKKKRLKLKQINK